MTDYLWPWCQWVVKPLHLNWKWFRQDQARYHKAGHTAIIGIQAYPQASSAYLEAPKSMLHDYLAAAKPVVKQLITGIQVASEWLHQPG